MRGPRGDHAQAFLSIAASDFFGKLAATAGCNMELLGQLWNLVTSSLKVFFIILLATGILIWFYPEEINGVVGSTIKILFVVSLSGTIVNIIDLLRLRIPEWRANQNTANAALERQVSDEDMTLKSIDHLDTYEKNCLRKALSIADETGIFRKWKEVPSRYDGPNINGALKTFRERKIIVPSNPAQEGYTTSVIEFWKLSPVVLRKRLEITNKLQ